MENCIFRIIYSLTPLKYQSPIHLYPLSILSMAFSLNIGFQEPESSCDQPSKGEPLPHGRRRRWPSPPAFLPWAAFHCQARRPRRRATLTHCLRERPTCSVDPRRIVCGLSIVNSSSWSRDGVRWMQPRRLSVFTRLCCPPTSDCVLIVNVRFSAGRGD